MRAHWRHLANAIELVLPSARLSPQPKRQIDQFSHVCTADGKVLSGMPGHVFFGGIIAPSHGGSGPYVVHASLGPPKSITQMASRLVQPFLHSSLQYHYAVQFAAPFPLLITPSHGRSGPHFYHDSFGSSAPSTQTASRSLQPFLQGSLV